MKSEIVLIKNKQAQHILSGKGFPLLESGFPWRFEPNNR